MSCSRQFSPDHVHEIRSHCFTLSRCELDMAVLGQLMATNCSETVVTESRHTQMARKKYTKYYHQGSSVCHAMFCFLHGIGETRMKNVTSSYKSNGLTPRTHGNTRRLPMSTLSLASVEYVVRFLLNYTELNCLLLPGRVPGYSRLDIILYYN